MPQSQSKEVSLMEKVGTQQNKELVIIQRGVHDHEGMCTLLKSSHLDIENDQPKPLLCFGCGIGWFLFIMGFIFPILWYFATILYFKNYHLKNPRERDGLAASAIAIRKMVYEDYGERKG
ncbi:60S ribosomal protein L18a-1 [Acorus calamus]|uniref:60S ribosomal protein L18a-1 n=1 Tax=Acorus calamus TaxID=4465 RepID=A0AAV9D6D2_ACOCL|nr:60S ribosomal protein L18a-1 [Acorus calamus]